MKQPTHSTHIRPLGGLLAALWLAAALLLSGCADEALQGGGAPPGTVQVNFLAPGTYGAPLSDLNGRATERIGEIPIDPQTGNKYVPGLIDDGTTLWVAVYEGDPETAAADARPLTVKSYRVSETTLIPCKVDEEGNVVRDADGKDLYDTPLYLPTGRQYYFRALGPALPLVDQTSLHIDNGEWLIANDERYAETAGNATATLTDTHPDVLVPLKPLINQTARLKFTLYSPDDDPYVHTLKMQPIGVEISGLQDQYSKAAEGGQAWNWTLCSLADTLVAFPGNKQTTINLREPEVSTNERFVIQTPILPTDAVATPLIVLFNMEVNGNPTQFEMMLNRKIFRAGYSYHYRGRVSIQDGIAVLDWESVMWSADVPFFPSVNP